MFAKFVTAIQWATFALAAGLLFAIAVSSAMPAYAQLTKPPTLKYVMTYQVDAEPGQPVAENRIVFNVIGGWVKFADGATGRLIPPAGDWLFIRPNGTFNLNVRVSAKMDDDSVILMEYGGLLKLTQAGSEKFNKGELVTGEDFYWIVSSTMQTASTKYAWLNDAVFVHKAVELGPKPYAKYDVYMVVP
jgi:hypothetical protein